MAVTIRTAVTGDAEAVATLTRRAFASQSALYDDDSLPPLSDTADTVLAAMSAGTVLIAQEDGVILGSVRGEMRERTCLVGRLVVEPLRQGGGIGRALALEIERRFPDAERFEIFTGHASAGPLHLYESLGYVRYRENPVHERLSLVYLEKA